MNITTRMGYAVRKFHTDNGKWPDTVSLGRKELSELSVDLGYVPTSFTFLAHAQRGELFVRIGLLDAGSELTCSING